VCLSVDPVLHTYISTGIDRGSALHKGRSFYYISSSRVRVNPNCPSPGPARLACMPQGPQAWPTHCKAPGVQVARGAAGWFADASRCFQESIGCAHGACTGMGSAAGLPRQQAVHACFAHPSRRTTAQQGAAARMSPSSALLSYCSVALSDCSMMHQPGPCALACAFVC